MIELALAIGGALVGFLISVGVHKKEHEMITQQLEGIADSLSQHDRRLDKHDVIFAKISTSLEYLTKAVDRNFDAIEGHVKEGK